jgi:hypothetical protein
VGVLPAFGCYEPSIEGLIDPDADCHFSVDGSIRKTGTLDLGPTPAFAHAYEGVMLVEGRADKDVSSASVAFSSNDERLPKVTVDGEEFVFPSVEGERHSLVLGKTDASGRAAVPFALVTDEEAAALQVLLQERGDFDLLVELRAVIGGRGTTYPSFVELRICDRCLVGVGAELQGDELVCPDDSPPAPVEPPPCRAGQDDIFSSCESG